MKNLPKGDSMKNQLVIYSNLLKESLKRNGCTFIMQKSETISRSLILQFKRNGTDEKVIHKAVEPLHCIHMVELGKDIVTILLQEEI